MQAENGLLSFADSNKNKAQSLFKSEGYFWLITATAVSFAAEILDDGNDGQHSQEVLALFNQCIRQCKIEEKELEKAKSWALAGVIRINEYNDQAAVFRPQHSVKLCRCFTTYWLFFKLIELEWQEILDSEEIAETYQFMDTVIADGEEMAEMEARLLSGEELDEDSKIYLRSHWRQVRSFWYDLKQDLLLLSQGLVPYQPLLR